MPPSYPLAQRTGTRNLKDARMAMLAWGIAVGFGLRNAAGIYVIELQWAAKAPRARWPGQHESLIDAGSATQRLTVTM